MAAAGESRLPTRSRTRTGRCSTNLSDKPERWPPAIKEGRHDPQTFPVPTTKAEERNAFLVLAVFLAPALAFASVGTLGLAIWISQMFFGPPTG
ncbi:periplasmic nitrate reductase, NapE protein [Gemmobacter lanyuensis]